MDNPAYPRHARVTPTDHGALVNIASWTLLCTSILFTAFRLLSNVVLRGQIVRDDWTMLATTALACGQVGAMSAMVKNGLGQHQDTLTTSMIESFEQALLASSVLYVAVLAFSKFSLLLLLSRLITTNQKTFKLVMRGSWIIMGLYLVAELLVLSFQCNLPKTYDFINGKCINLLAFWDFDAVFDILSSLTILALPLIIIQPIQMPKTRKLQAISAFLFQIPNCAFAIVRLVYLHKAYNDPDHTWAAVNWQIWTAINMHFNIIAANVPCLKIFFDGFKSTLLRAEPADPTGSVLQHSRGSNKRPYGRPSNPDLRRSRPAYAASSVRPADSSQQISAKPHRLDDGEYKASAGPASETRDSDKPSSFTSEGNGNGIKKTTSWSVLHISQERR